MWRVPRVCELCVSTIHRRCRALSPGITCCGDRVILENCTAQKIELASICFRFFSFFFLYFSRTSESQFVFFALVVNYVFFSSLFWTDPQELPRKIQDYSSSRLASVYDNIQTRRSAHLYPSPCCYHQRVTPR